MVVEGCLTCEELVGVYSQEMMGLILRRVLVFEEVIVLHRQNCT